MNEEAEVVHHHRLSWKKKLAFASIVLVLVLLICLIMTEVFSILLIKKLGWNYEPAYLRILKGYTSSNLVGGRTEYHPWGSWGVPNYEGRIANNCIDVKYKFNSYGARDKEREKTGQNRTIVLGDSFMEGWGVDQDKIFAAQMEKITGKEYLNFGFAGSGTGPLNEYVIYRDLANQYEHDTVMVGMYVGNDFGDNDPAAWGGSIYVYYRPFWQLTEDKKDFEIKYFAEKVDGKFTSGLEPENRAPHFTVFTSWKEFSALYNLMAVLRNRKLSLSIDGAGAQQFAYKLEHATPDSQTATLLIYDKFAKLIGDKKKIVFMIPAASDVFYYVSHNKEKIPQFEEFKQKLSAQGWTVIDTIDAFANLPQDQIADYFICDGHWNDKGDQLAAEYISKIIH